MDFSIIFVVLLHFLSKAASFPILKAGDRDSEIECMNNWTDGVRDSTPLKRRLSVIREK